MYTDGVGGGMWIQLTSNLAHNELISFCYWLSSHCVAVINHWGLSVPDTWHGGPPSPSLQTLAEFITLTVWKPFTLNTTGHRPCSPLPVGAREGRQPAGNWHEQQGGTGGMVSGHISGRGAACHDSPGQPESFHQDTKCWDLLCFPSSLGLSYSIWTLEAWGEVSGHWRVFFFHSCVL